MKPYDHYAQFDLAFDISWEKQGIRHSEHYFVNGMNCWRDIVPGSILENILCARSGDELTFHASAGELVPQYSNDYRLRVKKQQLLIPSHKLQPGRFYPQGLITGVPGIFKGNITPFRVLQINDDDIAIDLNHPLADRPIDFSIQVIQQSGLAVERGGSCTDWLEIAFSGPGMQSGVDGQSPVFSHPGAFGRSDPSPDKLFYSRDRCVSHIDRTAQQQLTNLYRGVLKNGDKVLDLMAGWQSHLPGDLVLDSVHGLGMNEKELEENSQLTHFSTQDLNQEKTVLFADHSFDAVICSLSVEYLSDPVEIFRQVARVLKPGGLFIAAFSNRWFPEKAIHIWKDLHDFERMGLVLEYFKASDRFERLSTFSVRGHPRPEDDRYAMQISQSDPIFAVLGKTIA